MRTINIKINFCSLCLLFASFGLLSFVFHPSALAQALNEEIEFRTHYYEDNAGLTVTSPSIMIRKDLSERTLIILKHTRETFEFDPAKSGSATAGGAAGDHQHPKSNPHRALSALDAVSGASALVQGSGSGFKEIRKEIVVGLQHRRNQNIWGGSYASSNEDDYDSIAFGLFVSRDFFQKNTNVSINYSHSDDEVDNVNRQPGEQWPRDKETHSGTISLTQLLSPLSYFRVAYELARNEGYLASPYRIVRISATEFPESHPNTRLRQSLYAGYHRYFTTRTASQINGSLYRDDWGVQSYSAEFRFYHYISDPLTLRLRYRRYSQTRADFFVPGRVQPSTIMSADPKLRDFDTDLYGIKFVYRLSDLPFRLIDQIDLELAFDRLKEPLGFRADLAQFVFRMNF